MQIGFQPKDILALFTIAIIGILKLKGLNGGVDVAGSLILGYYFAKRQQGLETGQ